VRNTFRRPLIVMTPKSLLRNKQAVSPIDDFLEKTHFQDVIDDGDKQRAQRILLCSGKVYYDLLEQRAKETKPVAIVRLEQFYPFPKELLERALNKYGDADIFWVQEESHNMGGWFFIEPRLRALGFDVKYVGRDDSASPATGSLEIHKREQRELVRAAFHADRPHLVSSANVLAIPQRDGEKQSTDQDGAAGKSGVKAKN
jgi:2-oxoglutarate dehydrogenase E1 component